MKIIYFLAVIISLIAYSLQQNAIAVLHSQVNGTVVGFVRFTQKINKVVIYGQVEGLSPGGHGFHIHAFGDLSNGCASTGGHYNPFNNKHGAPEDFERHVGDLGNIYADEYGFAQIYKTDPIIMLYGSNNILGRAVVVHSGEDDLGKTDHKDSLTTGNAGSRYACGVIGIK